MCLGFATWLLRFLQPKWNFFKHLGAVLWSMVPLLFTHVFGCFHYILVQFWTLMMIPKLNYIVHSSVWLSNDTQCEAMHDIVGFVMLHRAISCDSWEYLIALAKSNQLWRQETPLSIEERELFMVPWGIPLCTSGLFHCMGRVWLLVSE